MSSIHAYFKWVHVGDSRSRGLDDARPGWSREGIEHERYWQQPELHVRALLNVISGLAGWTADVVQFDLENAEDVAALRRVVFELEAATGSLDRLLDKRATTLEQEKRS